MGRLRVADEEYKKMQGLYEGFGSQIEEAVERYISIMDSVVSGNMIGGNYVNRLVDYVNKIQKLKGQTKDITDFLKKDIQAFIDEIDKKDQYLY